MRVETAAGELSTSTRLRVYSGSYGNRADSQSDQGHEQMEDSQRQQHGLGVGQCPPEVPEAAAKTVGKGLEDHHPADVWREDAELLWEKQAQKQST